MKLVRRSCPLWRDPIGVKPRASLAFAIGIGYAVLFLVLGSIVNIDYDAISESTHSVIWGIVVPLAIGSLLLAALTSVPGWWRPALREQSTHPPRPPRWMLAIPIVVLAITLDGRSHRSRVLK